MKKEIKVKFVDFYDSYNPKEHFLYQALERKYHVVLSDKPDYLFFSVFGDEHLHYDCIKIFYTGENLCPDFNLCDYAIGFEYLEYQDRYMRLPNYYHPAYAKDLNAMLKRTSFTEEDLVQKEGFCSFVYSNGNADPIREIFFEQLSQYKQVHSGGKFKNNIGGPVADKIEFQRKYKFCLAFENSSHPGYTTEKLIQAYASNAIPIYWGDPFVTKVFNEKSFINVGAYNTIEDAIAFIQKIDRDDSLYLEMMHESPLCVEENVIAYKMDELSAFLSNIMEQPFEKAKRYNRVCIGKKYIQKLKLWNKAYDKKIKVRMKKFIFKMKKFRVNVLKKYRLFGYR